MWIYNPGSNSWRAGPPYSVDHQGPGAALFNGRGFAVGGGAASGGSTAVESIGPCGPTPTPTATPTGSPSATATVLRLPRQPRPRLHLQRQLRLHPQLHLQARLQAAVPTPRLLGLAQSRLAHTDTGSHCDDCDTAISHSHSRSAFTDRPLTVQTSAPTVALNLVGTARFLHPRLSGVAGSRIGTRRFSRIRMTCAQINFPAARASLAEPVAFSPQSRAPRLTGSLTLSGAWCTSPTPLRQPTLKWSFTRANQASLTSSMAQRPTAALMRPAECKQARAVRLRPSRAAPPR